MQRKKILITGASGFIGGFLVDEALKRNYEVWAGIRVGSNKSNRKHSASCVFFSPLFLPTFVASL